MTKKLVQIEVVIGRDGKTTIEGKGFTGGTCLKETKLLEEALGKVSSRAMKPEASNTTSATENVKVGG